jgi:hypothetical protein
MTTEGEMTADKKRIYWDSGVNIFLGLWLIVAPFLLGYSDTAAPLWNDIILGVAIALLAAIRVFGALKTPSVSWTNVVLGAWLVVAPFILGYSGLTGALWNDILIGLLVIILGWRSATATA